jgi:hypoxanthine phosphoribosyltransferase
VRRSNSAISAVLRIVRTALEEAGLSGHDRIIVGFSGGPDSLGLLWSLQHLAHRGLAPTPIPVHIDHGLQSRSSTMAERAIALGSELGLVVRVVQVNVSLWPEYKEGGLEAGARAARYAALAQVAQAEGTSWITVGHTRDDQAETVLLRLLRGAGLDGLAAMRPVTELRIPLDPLHREFASIRLIRPLLRIRRSVVRAAVELLGLQPLEDPTNLLLSYERNAIRRRVLPILEQLRPGTTDALAQVAEQLREDAEFLQRVAREASAQVFRPEADFLILDRAAFRALDPALQRRILQTALREHWDPTWSLSRERLVALRKALVEGQAGRAIELGHGLVAVISYTEAVLGPGNRIEQYLRNRSGRPLIQPGSVLPLRSGTTLALENEWELAILRAPAEGWVVRTRRPGDRLVRPGQPVPVRLQDWLVNEKVPSYLRDWLPLVASDGIVHWIPGLQGEHYRSPDGTVVLELVRKGGVRGVSETAQAPSGELERVLIDEATLQRRVAELGEEIARAYQGKRPVLIGILTGAFVFMADLVRHLPIDLDIDFMAVSSYGQATVTSGVVRIIKDLDRPIEGRDVLLVEDIIDSGLTLQYLLDVLQRRNPRSLRVVVLLRKQKPGAVSVRADWVGFDIPDEFVVGYGLDAAGRFRNLPFIAVYRNAARG